MWTRRQFLSNGALGALLAPAGAAAFAFPGGERQAMPDGSQARGMITPQADSAIERGLDYLARQQSREGWWGTGGYTANVAVTSVAALAMMAGGHLPGRGKYGDNVKRALQFVLAQGERVGFNHPPGFLFNFGQGGQQGPMYSHGFGTLFAGEVCGMIPESPLRERARDMLGKAVGVIRNAQNHEGGWRYTPQRVDADISVTVCQIMALRSARNAGLFVAKSVVDRCIEYVKHCRTGDGSFMYQANRPGFMMPGNGGFARTAAGLAALFSAGQYTGREIDQSLDYLLNSRPQHPNRGQADMHYFYGHYYAVQVMWTAGGQYWAQWFPSIRNELISRQDQQGAWIDMICSHYGTAMACIILQVPNNYLPILQK